MTETSSAEILHDGAQGRFSTNVDGHTGYVEYAVRDGVMEILHTVVPKEIGGRGIAGQLVRAALEFARAGGLKVLPTCGYAAAWMGRHPEYAGLRAG